MEKIFWLGNPFFAADLRECGWKEVFIHNPPSIRPYGWNDLVNLAGFVPDLVVYADTGPSPCLLGMEDFPCLTVFYSVDSHSHSWHPAYAQAFDACLVSHYDHISSFIGPFLAKDRVWWSPPYARDDDAPSPEIPASTDCLFVGTINEELLPKRSAFLNALKTHIPDLLITSGEYKEIFPRGRVLVNHSEHAELNFRVFEAMGCGGCLVTPRINNGLDRLFVDGEEMVAYVPEDAGDAAYRIKFLLENPDLREYIARTALEKINAGHRAIHRAQAFTDNICDLALFDTASIIRERKSRAEKIRSLSLAPLFRQWAGQIKDKEMGKAFLEASQGIPPN